MHSCLPIIAIAIALTLIWLGIRKASRSPQAYNRQRTPGENSIFHILNQVPGYKKILRDCFIEDENGTEKVDFVLLHESGIFIFTFSDYNGWIYGSEYSQEWSLTPPNSPGSVHSIKFLNPVVKSKRCTRIIKDKISGPMSAIHAFSYVVFGDQCVLRDITTNSSTQSRMCQLKDLRAVLLADIEQSGTCYAREEIDTCYQTLHSASQVSEKVRQIYRSAASESRPVNISPAPARKSHKTAIWAIITLVFFLLLIILLPSNTGNNNTDVPAAAEVTVTNPDTGTVFCRKYENISANITVTNDSSKDAYVRMVDSYGFNALSFFVRAHESTTLQSPTGTYQIYVATGSTWQDEESLFGESTVISVFNDKFVIYYQTDNPVTIQEDSADRTLTNTIGS